MDVSIDGCMDRPMLSFYKQSMKIMIGFKTQGVQGLMSAICTVPITSTDTFCHVPGAMCQQRFCFWDDCGKTKEGKNENASKILKFVWWEVSIVGKHAFSFYFSWSSIPLFTGGDDVNQSTHIDIEKAESNLRFLTSTSTKRIF